MFKFIMQKYAKVPIKNHKVIRLYTLNETISLDLHPYPATRWKYLFAMR